MDESRGELLAFPTQDDIVGAESLLEWIDESFLRLDPYAFPGPSFRRITSLMVREFGIDPNGVYCIGSGAIGLSINPSKIADRKLKTFDDKSDIDLAIISETHFETAWRDLRKASQPTLTQTSEVIEKNLNWQRKKFFDGAILANKLISELSFGRQWLAASVKLEQAVAVALDRNIDVNYWIYRDYWSLRNYVATGLIRCREALV